VGWVGINGYNQNSTYLTKFNSSFSARYEDYLVNRISSDTAIRDTEYWHLALNFKTANLGGGQMKVQSADSVVWALVSLNGSAGLLKLKGPRSASVNTEIIVTVIDGDSRQPVSEATVKEIDGSQTWTTGSNGEATIRFTSAGEKRLKAERLRGRYVRSNALTVTVRSR
jgi:hypothetical protein